MRRRTWLVAVALLVAGCSSSKKSRGPKGRARLNRGPQNFGNLIVEGCIADLQKGPADKQVAAAAELGRLGADAKPALPALKKLVADKNPKVSAAAKAAVAAIEKR